MATNGLDEPKSKVYRDGVRRRIQLPLEVTGRHHQTHSPFWMLLKNLFVGMDLNRISIPIAYLNALSELQRASGQFYDADLLRQASTVDDPIQRLQLVSAFFVSSLLGFVNESNLMQYNTAILGETFEVSRPDLGFRFVAESGSYKPMESMVFVESIDLQGNPDNVYRVHYSSYCDVIFHGKIVEVQPGRSPWIVELPQRQEVYTSCYDTLRLIVGNFLRGISQSTFRLGETMTINHHAGSPLKIQTKATLAFHLPSKGVDWFGGYKKKNDPIWCDGYIESASDGQRPVTLFGPYMEEFYSISTETLIRKKESCQKMVSENRKVSGQNRLWKRADDIKGTNRIFLMSEFHMQLNEMPPLEVSLPPTDARFRPDTRFMETGFFDEADDAKLRIEQKQQKDRDRRMAKANGEDPWKPLWFERVENPYPETQFYWKFTGAYWNRDWSKCPDLGFLAQK